MINRHELFLLKIFSKEQFGEKLLDDFNQEGDDFRHVDWF